MSLKLRKATIEDVDLILFFIKQLAIYEKEPDAAVATKDDIIRDGFGEKPYFHIVIAEWENKPAGFAFYFFNYSTWLGKPGLYLEDLFVIPEFRGHGIGKALLVELAKIAVENNCGRFQWQVLDWNKPAIDFYESLGAFHLKEWFTYRITGDALVNLSKLL
jgi:GNAT superfamily N-acetyltransferase